MKNLSKVFKFELYNNLNKKAFKVTTIILCAIIVIGLTIPTIASALGKPLFEDEEAPIEDIVDEDEKKMEYGIIIQDENVDLAQIQGQIPHVKLVEIDSSEILKDKILSEELESGFIVKSPTSYEYVVKNTSMTDGDSNVFEYALLNVYREKAISEKGLDYGEIESVYNTGIESHTEVLGKDGIKNYFYTYILVFMLYFIIIFYGQMIATSVASEKSNRSMEILVTSTSTNSLIFGKVFAGALAGILQFAALIVTAIIAYKLNASAWGDNLDFLFDIPGNVLAIFAVFGSLGYLLYLFVYGVVGALVSRTEDINTSATPITFLFIGAFAISMIGLSNPDLLIVKIASFFPFTSFMAMFVRVSMGVVPLIQVLISLAILLATTIATGLLGAKIYRLGTLMYGNPIKLSQAFKMIRKK